MEYIEKIPVRRAFRWTGEQTPEEIQEFIAADPVPNALAAYSALMTQITAEGHLRFAAYSWSGMYTQVDLGSWGVLCPTWNGLLALGHREQQNITIQVFSHEAFVARFQATPSGDTPD